MRKALTDNLGLKLLSLLFAVIIWLIIVYTYDPADTATFNIDVDIINGDAITSLNKVYEVIEGETVTIQAKGNSSLINSLKSSDFKATADISKLSPTLHADINVVCLKSNNVEISFVGKVSLLAIKLEDVTEKQFKVSVDTVGTAADGYYVGSSTTKPNLVQVSGAKSSIDKISTVRVLVNVDGASENMWTEAEPKAYDANGEEIKTGSLKFSTDPIAVTTVVYGTKEIPVVVETEGEPYAGYRVAGIEYEPKSVILAGDSDKLLSIDSIVLPVGVSNRITSLEESIELSEYIPAGLYLTDTEATVNVQVTIERLASRTFEVPYDYVQFRNANNAEFMYIITDEGSFTVKVLGPEAEISGLGIISLRPYIDLQHYNSVGEYSAEIQFDLGEEFKVNDHPFTLVELQERPVIEEEEPEEDGETEDGHETGESGPQNESDDNDSMGGTAGEAEAKTE